METRFQNYFETFRDILHAVHSSTSVREVLEVVVKKSTEVLNAKGAFLRILNKKTNQFEVGAGYGMGQRYMHKGPVSTEKLLPDPGQLHQVIIITDIRNALRVEYPQLAWDEGVRMMLDVPLAVEDRLIGLIRIYLETRRKFSVDELDFIKTVADQCACIIERVQLIEDQQARFSHLATQIEKMSSLGRMAAGIAHEINNPLGGILLFASNMSKKVEPGSAFEKGIKIIIRETQRCKTITQGLLEFARDKKSQKVAANINDVITTAVGVVQNEFYLKHVNLEKQLFPDQVQTLLDENQIEQVILNLLLNALNAVEDHGRVAIKSRLNRGKNTIEVEVADNGCGIAASEVKKVFEPFYSTRHDGTGLGLAVSYGIIQNHQGHIHVFSEPGKGSQFTIELPLADKEPHMKEEA